MIQNTEHLPEPDTEDPLIPKSPRNRLERRPPSSEPERNYDWSFSWNSPSTVRRSRLRHTYRSAVDHHPVHLFPIPHRYDKLSTSLQIHPRSILFFLEYWTEDLKSQSSRLTHKSTSKFKPPNYKVFSSSLRNQNTKKKGRSQERGFLWMSLVNMSDFVIQVLHHSFQTLLIRWRRRLLSTNCLDWLLMKTRSTV